MSRLCDSCVGLSLTVHRFTISPNRADMTEEVIRQDFLATLKNAKSCQLCQLIAFAVEDTRQEWEKEHVPDDTIRCSIRLMSYRFPTPRPFKVLDIRTQFPFYGPSHGIQLLPVGMPDDPQVPLIGRYMNPSQVSLPYIKMWIQKCIEHHGHVCGLPKSPRFSEIQAMMLLIDVECNCIVSPIGEYQYLALSYVWGKTNSVLLTKENIADFQQPGSLTKLSGKLPSTLRDAIRFTKDIGQKYIWIDSICIIQNDPEFKSKIIHKMNLVYENAFMTIIAASGSDANSGLPGVQESTRSLSQQAADIDDNLKLIYARSHQSLAKSIWATRGWTYQEYYFSKRRLIFHNGLVFYHCRTRSWREDVALEGFDKEPRQFDLSLGFDAASEFWEPRTQDSNFWDTYMSFWHSVRAYKKREISYDSDALNAFAGITEHVRIDKGMATFWGLPLQTFVSDLFWQPDLFGVRRSGFPTWSWAGWTGDLANSELGGEEHQFLSSWISIFRLESIEPGSLKFLPIHPRKDVSLTNIPESSQEECLTRTLIHLKKIISVGHLIHDGKIQTKKFYEIPDVRESVYALTKLARPKFDLTQTLAANSLDPTMKSQAIYFRTLIAHVWVSACAPNGQVFTLLKRVNYVPIAQFRPTLYMYSTQEPTPNSVGLAWIQIPSVYLEIVEQTKQVAPKEIQRDMKPGNTGGIKFTADPRVICSEDYGMAATSQNSEAPSSQPRERAREIEKQLRAFAAEQQYPYDSISTLPKKPSELEEILRSRRVMKVKIALISGPVTGDVGGRMGVPFGYSFHGRRFFRALILMDSLLSHPHHSEKLCFSQKIGVAELEIDALPRLEDLQFEEIVLV